MASKFSDDSKYKFRSSEVTFLPIQDYEKEPLVTREIAVESLVPQVNHMVWTLEQNYDKPKGGLSLDESASVRLYTLGWKTLQSSFHYILNAVLHSENRQDLVPWFLYLRLFIFALSKLPSSSNRVFFCQTKTNNNQDYPEGKLFVRWDFISCTLSIKLLDNSLDENKTMFIIECDLAKDISQHSYYETQNGILLYPARQFQTISSYDLTHQLRIIHLKEIQPRYPLTYIPETSSTEPTTTSKKYYHLEQLHFIINKCPRHTEVD